MAGPILDTDRGVVSELWRYPVKSLRGERLDHAILTATGIQGDRLWMLVDASGDMVTQRTTPVLASIEARWISGRIVLEYPGMDPLLLLPPAGDAPVVNTAVWGSAMPLCDASDAAASWISAVVGQPLRMVHMPRGVVRRVNPRFDPFGDTQVGLADGYPITIVSTASVQALAEVAGVAITPDRFRANIVVDGFEPWDEDTWQTLIVGCWKITVTKPCERCSVPGVDQQTGRKTPGVLKALHALRGQAGGAPLFGINAVARLIDGPDDRRGNPGSRDGQGDQDTSSGQKANLRPAGIDVGDTMTVLVRS
ncbi:MAG: MOSC N-terminal beta barrel domain-containing protein [Actinobacteria bacterium]|nr:MOSC N-terminal beta barrel domain-containing protein [Actinomycetota bacterium]